MKRFKRIVLRLWPLALWVVLTSGYPAALLAAGGVPRAAVPEETHDAGRILQGKKIEHAFVVANKGDSVLNILSAKPG